MKKIVILVVTISLSLALSACGSSNNQQGTAANQDADVANAQQINLHATNYKYDKAAYHVKKGQPVKIKLFEDQGIHGAEIQAFGINLGPGNTTAVFTPKKAGTYEIRCSVPCGPGHLNMKSTLVVE